MNLQTLRAEIVNIIQPTDEENVSERDEVENDYICTG
jgi:hypothetical protein